MKTRTVQTVIPALLVHGWSASSMILQKVLHIAVHGVELAPPTVGSIRRPFCVGHAPLHVAMQQALYDAVSEHRSLVHGARRRLAQGPRPATAVPRVSAHGPCTRSPHCPHTSSPMMA